MADIARIIAEVVLQSKEAIAAWKQFGQAGVDAFKQVAAGAVAAGQKAGAAFSKMATQLKNIGAQAQALGAKMRGVGSAISIGIGAPLLLLARTAINSFKASQASVAQFDAVFANVGKNITSTAEDMKEFAKTAQQSLPQSDEAVLDMQASLLTFGNIAEKEFTRARQVVLDYATATGTELTAASDLVGKALADPIRGLRGLREAHIALSAEQRASIAAFMAVGDIAGAQDVILKAFTKTYHDAASEIAKTDTSQATIQANLLDDALEDIGKQLIPLQIRFLTFVTGIAKAFNSLPEGVQTFLVAVAGILVVLGPILFVVGQMIIVFGSLAGAVSLIVPTFLAIGAAIAGLGGAFFAVVSAIGAAAVAIAAFIGWPILLAIALGALVVVVITCWDDIVDVFWKGVALVGQILSDAWKGAGEVLRIAIGMWKSSWNLFVALVIAGANRFKEAILAAINFITAPMRALIQLAKDAWSWVTKANAAKAGGGIGAMATGGQVHGRGGRDKILAYLTNEEFVHRVAAVKKYGTGFMHSVNNLSFPVGLARGYYAGGLVSAAPRMGFATGGQAKAGGGGGRGFTLVIDGTAFGGLSAPAETAEQMVRFSRERQMRSTGRAPAWFK